MLKKSTSSSLKGAVSAQMFSWLCIMAVLFMFTFTFQWGCKPKEESKPPAKTGSVETFGIVKDSDKLQVGVVTVGPVSDWGWNYQQNQGRLGMEARMRGKVHTVIVENIPENADAERMMQRMADAGAKLIFSTSYGYKDFCLRAAQKRPDVVFMQAQAPLEAKNAAT